MAPVDVGPPTDHAARLDRAVTILARFAVQAALHTRCSRCGRSDKRMLKANTDVKSTPLCAKCCAALAESNRNASQHGVKGKQSGAGERRP